MSGPDALNADVSLREGSTVEIKDLQSKPELNGQRGTITAPLNASGRWPVRVDGGADEVAIKPDNLSLVPAVPAGNAVPVAAADKTEPKPTKKKTRAEVERDVAIAQALASPFWHSTAPPFHNLPLVCLFTLGKGNMGAAWCYICVCRMSRLPKHWPVLSPFWHSTAPYFLY